MNPPDVSFIIPTLNAERHLASCLRSIRMQRADPASIEILVADGGSRDRTATIAAEFGATVMDAAGRMAEAAKRLAFEASTGRHIVLLDADNEIVGPDWLSRSVAAMDRHPDALGFESYYLPAPDHTALNRYLTACLQISDPYARFLAGRLRLRRTEPDGTQVFELPGDGSYPTGANGFVFRRDLLARLADDAPYHEAVFFPALMRAGVRTLLKIPGCGIHHHYVTGWRDYFRKRQRAMIIRAARRDESPATWDEGGRAKKCLALLYFSTALGPMAEGMVRAVACRNTDWLLHPLAGLVSTAGNASGVLLARRHASRTDRIRLSQKLHGDTGRPRA